MKPEFSVAELTAIEIATTRTGSPVLDQLEHQLLNLIAGREHGHKGHRGWWKPEDQGFTRSSRRAVDAWRKHAQKLLLVEASFYDRYFLAL